jgi:hypothetical protein
MSHPIPTVTEIRDAVDSGTHRKVFRLPRRAWYAPSLARPAREVDELWVGVEATNGGSLCEMSLVWIQIYRGHNAVQLRCSDDAWNGLVALHIPAILAGLAPEDAKATPAIENVIDCLVEAGFHDVTPYTDPIG